MAINMHVVTTNKVEVPEDIEKDLVEAYAALQDLKTTQALSTDPFETVTEANKFVKQAKAWAESQTGPNGRKLVFARKGNIQGEPLVVTFRIYEARETKSDDQ